jgi:hypothetical protein
MSSLLATTFQTAAGGAQIAVTTAGAPVLRRWFNHHGATPRERVEPLPGDRVVPVHKLRYTRATTIAAPPAVVWAWLVQIGQDRAGLYSYDGLENLVGCDVHSAEELIPAHQHLEVGDLIRLGPDGYPCFRAVGIDAPRSLVLIGVDPKTKELPPIPAPTDESVTVATWQWVLRAVDRGRGTRLVVRQRLTYPLTESVLWHVVEPVGFVMEHRMLNGLKHRAETSVLEASRG